MNNIDYGTRTCPWCKSENVKLVFDTGLIVLDMHYPPGTVNPDLTNSCDGSFADPDCFPRLEI